MELSQEEKAVRLQQAVINSAVGELSNVCEELGYVEMAAPALGLACRFRGLDAVKVLVDAGITFDFPSTGEIETKYRCYIGQKYANYRTNYALYLLKILRGGLKGACSVKGMKFTQNAKRETGKPLPILEDQERLKVLEYLIQNKEKLSFQPEEMLFYAIYAKDTVIYEALKKHGVTLSERRVGMLTEGGIATDGYWHEYGSMTGKLADADYLEVMQRLAAELDGKPFYYTEKMFDITKARFHDIEIFEYFLSHFRQEKMKKFQIIRSLIDEGALDALPVIERLGWLGAPHKRDEMIGYASANRRTEALAWLLDYKNRTADFAAEQEKAERKMMRGLSGNLGRMPSPDSVTELKKIWSYRKQDDGTLVITNYKGTDTEVTVPERIGRSVVTAIGKGAFAGAAGRVDITIYATWEQMKHRQRKVTKIALPHTIRHIGKGAFCELQALREINIPEGVEEIDEFAFFACSFLKNITIPGTVKKIGKHAFAQCSTLEKVQICEGVLEIGERAFLNCHSLKEVHVPESVRELASATVQYGSAGYEVFSSCPDLTVYCPSGSRAEAYCREKGFRYGGKSEMHAGV